MGEFLVTPTLRLSLMFAATFMGIGAQMAFLPLWLQQTGLTAAEVGQLLAVGVLTRVVTGPVLAALADRFNAPGRALALMGLASASTMLAFLPLAQGGYTALLVAMVAMGSAQAALIPVQEGASYAAAERLGLSYGRARVAGSFAFAFANLAAGWLVGQLGAEVALWWTAACHSVLALLAWRFPIAHAPVARPAIWTEAKRLCRAPSFALFMVSAPLIQASHAISYNFASLHWRALGYDETSIGALWATGVAAEIALLWVAAPWVARLGAAQAMALGGGGAVLRWSLLTLDPGTAGQVGLVCLHALSFALTHMAAMNFLSRAVRPQVQFTAQSLFASVSGLIIFALTLIAAQLYAQWGAGVWWLAAAMALVGMVAALALARRWQGGLVLTERQAVASDAQR